VRTAPPGPAVTGAAYRPGAAARRLRGAAPTTRRPSRTRRASPAATSRTSEPRSGTAAEQRCTQSCATARKRQLTPCVNSSGTVHGAHALIEPSGGRLRPARRPVPPVFGLPDRARSGRSSTRSARWPSATRCWRLGCGATQSALGAVRNGRRRSTINRSRGHMNPPEPATPPTRETRISGPRCCWHTVRRGCQHQSMNGRRRR
jgi:hypothetical protein